MIKTGSSIYYWPKPNLIFVANPKCANTTIWHTLRDRFGGEDMQKLSKDQAQDCKRKRNSFTFTTIRNPYDRAVSMWSDKLARHTGATPRIMSQHPRLHVGIGFKDFLYVLITDGHRKRMWNQHFQPQTAILSGLDIDVHIPFEELEDMWIQQIHARFNIPHLPVENQSTHSPWPDYYDDGSLGLVNHLYQHDFEFGGIRYARIDDSSALLPQSGDVGDLARKLSAVRRKNEGPN